MSRWVQAGTCTLSRERGSGMGGSFLTTTQLKSSACAPSLTPPRHTRVTPCGKRASQSPFGRRRVSVTKGRSGRCTPPPRFPCQTLKGASSSELWTEVAASHPESGEAASPAQLGTGTGGSEPGRERPVARWRHAGRSPAPEFPSGHSLPPGGCAGCGRDSRLPPGAAVQRCPKPRHRPFCSTQALDSQPMSATSAPSLPGGPEPGRKHPAPGKEALAGRAGSRRLGGWVSRLEAGALGDPRERRKA